MCRVQLLLDAMGCQVDVARKIVEKDVDYCLVLKGNQKSLYEEVAVYFENLVVEQQCVVVKESGHGRVECWEYFWRQILIGCHGRLIGWG